MAKSSHQEAAELDKCMRSFSSIVPYPNHASALVHVLVFAVCLVFVYSFRKSFVLASSQYTPVCILPLCIGQLSSSFMGQTDYILFAHDQRR
jgi:hypothetical protein